MADPTFENAIAAMRKAVSIGDMAAAKRMAELANTLRPDRQSTADRIASAKAGTLQVSPESQSRADNANQIAEDRAVLADVGMIGAAGAKMTQGLPFIGEWVDEAGDALGGDGGRLRAVQGAMDRQYPKTSTALQVGGGVIGSIPLAAAAVPSIIAKAPVSPAAKVLTGIVAGGATGAVEGASSGAGRAQDGERLMGAARGAMIGGGTGAAVGALAPMVGVGVKALAERVKGLDLTTISQTFGISKEAAAALKNDLDALDFQSAQRNLDAAGPDAMLADAGISTREALDAAITGGGKAARIGTDAVSERAAKAGKKLERVMDLMLGTPQGVKASAKSIATRTAPARTKAYETAYSTAINYADDTGRAIEGVIARIPPKTLQAAVDEANDAMRAAGAANKQIMASIAPDGSVKFREMPNVQQLDEIKKALGTILQKETDPVTGKVTAAGIRARELARELKEAVGKAVPAYGKAVKLGGDKIAEDQALALGRNLFSPATTRETVIDTMKGASVEAQAAVRQGLRENIDNTLARVRRMVDDPNVDTRETLALLNTLSTRDAREKVVAILGQAKADRLLGEIDAVGKQLGTSQAIATGSATGRREARSRALDDALAPGAVRQAASGSPVKSVQALVQLVTRETPQAQLAQKQEVLAEVARALTEKRGPDAIAALKLVEKAITGQPLKSQEAVFLGRVAATTGLIGGYQSGTQYLTNRSGAR